MGYVSSYQGIHSYMKMHWIQLTELLGVGVHVGVVYAALKYTHMI